MTLMERLLSAYYLQLTLEKINRLDELEDLCDLSVRGLEELIDYQGYPVKAAENSTKKEDLLELVLLVLHITWQRTENTMMTNLHGS